MGRRGLSLGNLAAGFSAWSAVDVVRSGCAEWVDGIGDLLWTPWLLGRYNGLDLI